MPPSSRPMPARRLAGRLYAYLFLDDFVLLYPLYALLFTDAGLSTAQISSLFAVWAVAGLLVEIPSGVWADAVSRRLLLVLGPLLTATGFAVWVLAPSYPAFAAGFVLWGASGSLRSGALEALVYEELRRSGSASRYAAVMGRGRAAGVVAAAAGTGLAAPVLAAGGYAAIGTASVVACLAAAAVAGTFPEARGEHGPGDDPGDGPGDDGSREDGHGGAGPAGYRGFVHVLGEGLAQARARPPVRAGLLLVPAVAAVWGSLEEYTPLLAAGTGVAAATVPLLLVLLGAGQTLGGLFADRSELLSGRALAGVLAGAALLTAVGSLNGRPAGFVPLAVAFGAFQLATVAADARLQAAITGRARSTVTSLAAFATDVTTIGVYGLYAAGSTVAGHGTIFAAAALWYLAVAAALLRPRRAGDVPRRRRRVSPAG